MNPKELLKKYAVYPVAVLIFVVLAYLYCFPQLSGKTVWSSDNINAIAAVQESVRYTQETGDHSWWTGSLFSGMPNFQIGGGHYKSSDWLAPLRSILHKGHSNAAWVFIIYFLCFFILLRAFGVGKWMSIAGSITIALSSYFIVIIAAGHNNKTSTIALMSVVLAGFYLIFRKKYAAGIILSMLFTAAGFVTHPQMAYYIFMFIGVCWFAELCTHIREKRMKDFLIGTVLFAGAIGIGLGANCSNVFANAEYAEETMRGGHSDLTAADEGTAKSDGLDIEYATQWSYGIDETMTFLIPGFKGGSSSVNIGRKSGLYRTLTENGVPSRNAADFCSGVPMYWGEQPFTAGNVYMGAIVCFLFLLGLLIVEGPYKWALLSATLFSTALAWGHNFMWLTELFFKYFPMYSKFRAVSSILIVAEIAMPLLGFLAVKAIMEGSVSREKAERSILVSAGLTGGICLFFALFGPTIFDFTSSYDAQFASQLPSWAYEGILDERAALLRSDSWRSLLFILGGAAVMFLFVKGRLKECWMTVLLGALVLADLWAVDKRYFNDDNFVSPRNGSAIFAKQPYEELLLQDPDPHFRVFNLTTNTFNDARTSYRLKSLGGYSAAKLRRYQDIIDEHLSKMHWPVIGMLNAKYIITRGEDGQPDPQMNPHALGNAWYVGKLEVVDGARAECDALNTIDLHTTAVVDKSFEGFVTDTEPGLDEEAYVELTDYTPKSIDYYCSSSKPGTIVFSEIYYPHGWKVFLDGERIEHFRVNYILRAINVPAGDHGIHFVFDPDSVRKGDTIAVIFCILMYLLAAGLIAMSIWRKRKEQSL